MPAIPKCNHISARLIEIFLRLGVAAKLRDTCVFITHPSARAAVDAHHRDAKCILGHDSL